MTFFGVVGLNTQGKIKNVEMIFFTSILSILKAINQKIVEIENCSPQKASPRLSYWKVTFQMSLG